MTMISILQFFLVVIAFVLSILYIKEVYQKKSFLKQVIKIGLPIPSYPKAASLVNEYFAEHLKEKSLSSRRFFNFKASTS